MAQSTLDVGEEVAIAPRSSIAVIALRRSLVESAGGTDARRAERRAEAMLRVLAVGGIGLLGMAILAVAARGAAALWAPPPLWAGRALGSVVVATAAVAIALPVGTAAALWLRFWAPSASEGRGRRALGVLGVMPSVAVGVAGVVLGADAEGAAAWVAGLLAVLVLARLTGLADRALRRVPAEQLRAAQALGATRLQAVVHVVLPQAWRGLVAAGFLGLAAALGDAVIAVLVAGQSVGFGGWMAPVGSLAASIVHEAPGVSDTLHGGHIAASILVLGGLTYALHLGADLLLHPSRA